jgi:SOS-response transcriptional repressor LexA
MDEIKELSPQQKAAYDFIERYHAKEGIAPSVKDVADSLRIGISTARTHIEILKARGWVATTKGIRRSLRIIKTGIAQEAEQCR